VKTWSHQFSIANIVKILSEKDASDKENAKKFKPAFVNVAALMKKGARMPRNNVPSTRITTSPCALIQI
jgi:hypothetical protein